jgi:hypothetical protein
LIVNPNPYTFYSGNSKNTTEVEIGWTSYDLQTHNSVQNRILVHDDGTWDDSGCNNSYNYIVVFDAAIDFLVIGGGGGGGFSYGGGGGAGGYRTSFGTVSGGNSAAEAPIGVTTQAYTITVGDGGDGATAHRNPPLGNGDDSSIAGAGMTTITSIGGGGGGNITYLQPTGWGSGHTCSCNR